MLKRLEATAGEYLIARPTQPSEFEIQADIYIKLKVHGIDVRGEVIWQQITSDGKTKRREKCRFDLVIFEGGKAVEIVEIKDNVTRHKSGVEHTRQGRRYPRFGIPVTFVYGAEGAAMFLEEKLRDWG